MKNLAGVSATEYVFRMSEEEFSRSLHSIARSDRFSAVASGMGDEATFRALREDFVRQATPEELLETNEKLRWLVLAIARRVMR